MCDNVVLQGIIHSIPTSSASSGVYTLGTKIHNGRNCKEEAFGKTLVSFDSFDSNPRVSRPSLFGYS